MIETVDVPVERVYEVLMRDGWQPVDSGTFRVGVLRFGRTPAEESPAGTEGFEFQQGGVMFAGPLAALYAVRYSPSTSG